MIRFYVSTTGTWGTFESVNLIGLLVFSMGTKVFIRIAERVGAWIAYQHEGENHEQIHGMVNR
jgi:hypothetical protein